MNKWSGMWVAVAGAMMLASAPCRSAETPAPPTADKEYGSFRLKPTPADLVAWQIDPAHNTAPLDVVPAFPPARAKLPAGIDAVIAVKPQQAILAHGTKDGLAELGKMLSALDQPTAVVEVSAQVVALNATEGRFGAGDWQAVGDASVALSRGEYVVTPRPFKNRGSERMIVEGRLAVPNAATRKLTAVVLRPAVIGVQEPNGDTRALAGAGHNDTDALNIKSSINLIFTPVIGADGTITLQCDFERVEALVAASGTPVKTLQRKIGPGTTMNVRNNATVALADLPAELFESSRNRATAPGRYVAHITVCIKQAD